MTVYRDGNDISLKANGASCPAYRFATVDGSNQAGIHKTSTSKIIGVTQEDASATGEALLVRLYGTTKITYGASVAAGDLVGPQTATGKAITATDSYATGTTAVPRTGGIALISGSTNAVGEISINIDNISKEAFA